MNTRTFPRTTNEAFRNTAEYGAAIERPPAYARTKLASMAVGWSIAVGFAAVLAMLIAEAL